MHELEKILEEIKGLIEKHKNKAYELVAREPLTQCYTEADIEQIKVHELAVVRDIIRKHMTDGWIPVEERMPTKEECEKNQTGCIKFWITYGYRGNYSTLLANCKWVEADNEDGTTGDFAEFWVDQYPQIFYPSSNLIRGWKIIEAPDPYRPERGISIQQ